MPGNILERVGPRNRMEDLSEAISSLPGVLALLCVATLCRAPRGRCNPKLPEMRIWISSFEENISSSWVSEGQQGMAPVFLRLGEKKHVWLAHNHEQSLC